MADWSHVPEQYGHLVWATVYRILGQEADTLDCCQDVFAELLERSALADVRDWPAFLRWLSTRRALDHLRKRRTESSKFDSMQYSATLAATTLSPDSQACWHELIERVRQAVGQLPGEQAEAFWLRAVEQMSYAEIGKEMGVEVNHVGVLVHRARKKVRECLADLKPVKHSDGS